MAEQRGVFRRGLVEFVVIVVGVLVALGLESWWGDLQERELEQQYLASLREEAVRGISTIEGISEVTALKRRWLVRANRIFETGLVADSAPQFLEGALQGSGIRVVPQLSDAVYQDLLSTGRLALIRDDNIRRAIVTGYANIEALFGRSVRGSANVDSRLHQLVSRHVPVGMTIQTGPRLQINPDPARATDARRAALELAADPSLRGELRAALRTIESEENILFQLRLGLESQLTIYDGGRMAPSGFADFIRAEREQFGAPPPEDSALLVPSGRFTPSGPRRPNSDPQPNPDVRD